MFGRNETKVATMVAMMVLMAVGIAALLLAYRANLPPRKSVPDGRQAEYGRIETSADVIQFLAFSDNPGVSVIAIQKKRYHSMTRLFIFLDGLARKAMRAAFRNYENGKKIAQGKSTQSSKIMTTLEFAQLSYKDGKWRNEGDLDFSLVLASRVYGGANLAYGGNHLSLNDDQARAFSSLLREDAVNRGYREAIRNLQEIDMLD